MAIPVSDASIKLAWENNPDTALTSSNLSRCVDFIPSYMNFDYDTVGDNVATHGEGNKILDYYTPTALRLKRGTVVSLINTIEKNGEKILTENENYRMFDVGLEDIKLDYNNRDDNSGNPEGDTWGINREWFVFICDKMDDSIVKPGVDKYGGGAQVLISAQRIYPIGEIPGQPGVNYNEKATRKIGGFKSDSDGKIIASSIWDIAQRHTTIRANGYYLFQEYVKDSTDYSRYVNRPLRLSDLDSASDTLSIKNSLYVLKNGTSVNALEVNVNTNTVTIPTLNVTNLNVTNTTSSTNISDVLVSKSNAWLTVQATGTTPFTTQSSGISIGYGGYKSANALQLVFNGDKVARIGVGAITNGTPAYEAFTFDSTSQNVAIKNTVTINSSGSLAKYNSAPALTGTTILGYDGYLYATRMYSSYVQSNGLSTSWNLANGVTTGAFNAVMGTSSGATWLLSGTSGGTFRAGIQALDTGGTMYINTGSSNVVAISGSTITGNLSGNVTGNCYGNASSATWVNATVAGANAIDLVYGNMADNDQFRLRVGGTASNAGYVEIATADDAGEPIYVRQYSGVFTTLVRTAALLDGSGNTSFPGTVSAPTFSGSFSGNATTSSNCNGNSATATNLSTNRSNWNTNGTMSAVVGQLAWRNYGNGHTIFDASQSVAPDGSSRNNTNPEVAWTASYPTLMGFNGSSTYGVRVDSSRYADNATRLLNTRTISLSGDVTGSVSFDGTSNVTISTAVDNDSHYHSNSTLPAYTVGSGYIGYVAYNGTTSAAGQFDGGSTNPTSATRLNYNGYFYATRVYNAVWNDLAEFMVKSEESEAGDVMVMTKNGVAKSIRRAQKAVVGVHSDTFGYALGSENEEQKTPIGLTGRVNVKVREPLEIGDLLVSDSDGFASKATPQEEMIPGIIIGKVMEEKYDTDPSRVSMLILNR